MERLANWVPSEAAWIPSVVTDKYPPIVFPDRGKKASFLLMTESTISCFEDEKAQKLLSGFIKSQEFTFGVQTLKYFLLLKPENRKMSDKEFKARLAGFFFSSIAYRVLKRGLKQGERLLSPYDTEELYASLHPTKPKRNLYGLGLQMRRITIPDGILITEYEGRTEISRVYEYTLMDPENPRKIPQLDHYRNRANVIADLAPGLQGPIREICFPSAIQSRFGFPAEVEIDPDQLKVVFVFPRDDREDVYNNIPGRKIFLPIFRFQFSMFLDAVFKDTKNSLIPKVE